MPTFPEIASTWDRWIQKVLTKRLVALRQIRNTGRLGGDRRTQERPEEVLRGIDIDLFAEYLFIPYSSFILTRRRGNTEKIAMQRTNFMRGKGFEPLNSCENRS